MSLENVIPRLTVPGASSNSSPTNSVILVPNAVTNEVLALESHWGDLADVENQSRPTIQLVSSNMSASSITTASSISPSINSSPIATSYGSGTSHRLTVVSNGFDSSPAATPLGDSLALRMAPRKSHTWAETNNSALRNDDSDDDSHEDMISTYPPANPRHFTELSAAANTSNTNASSNMSIPVSIPAEHCATDGHAISAPIPILSLPQAHSVHLSADLNDQSTSPLLTTTPTTHRLSSTLEGFISSREEDTPASSFACMNMPSSLSNEAKSEQEGTIPCERDIQLQAFFAAAISSATAELSDGDLALSIGLLESPSSSSLTNTSPGGSSPSSAISVALPTAPAAPAVVPVPLSSPMPSSSFQSHLPLNPPVRPASAGPMKLHRRQKSGKRVPPPPFSPELLKAARLRLERTAAARASSSASTENANPSSAHSAESSHVSHVHTFSTRTYHHSRGSSGSSNGSSTSFGGGSFAGLSASSSYESLCSLGSSTPRHEYTLPQEIWSRVFRYMSPGDLLEISAVSHSWTTGCWERVLELDLSSRHEAGFSGCTWLKYLPHMTKLQRLTLTEKVPTTAALASIAHIKSIEWLSIRCSAYETTSAGLMAITELPKLKHLVLYFPSRIRPSTLQPLLPQLPTLEHLKVETLRQSFSEIAFANIDQMQMLKTLDLSWCKRLSPGIFARIARLSHLETLILDMCGGDVAMGGLSQLRTMPNLTNLSLKWCDHLTDAVLPIIAEFPALKTIDVSFCQYLTATSIASHLPNTTVIRCGSPLR